jgi:NADP-dependent 3-hydroxy acid dehydrogenase YdfG
MTSKGTALRGRTALITGGGTGIGAATARELADAGAHVAIVGRRDAPLGDVARSIELDGGRCLAISADVRDYQQLAAAVERTVAELGGLDILVANAARVDHGPVDVADPALWADVITTNVLGVLYSVRAALGHLYAADGRGHVVVVASASGRVTYVGEPAYVTSKHAVVAFADCLRKETAGRGVRVSVLEPGIVDTPFIDWEAVRPLMPAEVEPLQAADCARVIRFMLEQPANVGVNEVVMRPAAQAL